MTSGKPETEDEMSEPVERLIEIATDTNGRELWRRPYEFSGLSAPGDLITENWITYSCVSSVRVGHEIRTVLKYESGRAAPASTPAKVITASDIARGMKDQLTADLRIGTRKRGEVATPDTPAPRDECAWLIERGGLCLGTCENRLAWVTFTNKDAIRFARKRDALSMLEVLKWSLQKGAGKQFMDAIVTEHMWCAVPSPAETHAKEKP